MKVQAKSTDFFLEKAKKYGQNNKLNVCFMLKPTHKAVFCGKISPRRPFIICPLDFAQQTCNNSF